MDGDRAETKLPFGKHRGRAIGDVEEHYLRWLLDEEWFHSQYPKLVEDIENELRFRERWK